MRALILLFVIAATAACADRDGAPPAETPPSTQTSSGADTTKPGWSIAAVKDASDQTVPGDAASHVIFESGDTMVVPLINLQIIDIVHTGADAPWIVASGVECSNCDAPSMVTFLRAARGVTERPLRAYAFPGEQLEGGVEDGRVLARNQMFVGTCLDHPGAVVYEETPDSAGSWTKKMRVLSFAPAFSDSERAWDQASADRVAEAVRKGDCKEIPGRTQYVL